MTRFWKFLRDQSGTTTIEFILVFPVVFTVFTASVESSMYMAKYVMFERSVDKVVRMLRLGTLGEPTHQQLKQTICENGMLISSKGACMNAMRIWMKPIDTGNFAMGSATKTCVDKASDVNTGEPLASDFATGTDNDIMLMRICMKEWPMFPTTGVSVKMPTDSADGSVSMIVSTVFVNEPGT
jgi:Flp pilus assembly protein TadG